MDFTISKYRELLEAIQGAGYKAIAYKDYLTGSNSDFVILRHDVDRFPYNSLRIAELEAELGVRATYYFRAESCSWNKDVVLKISEMGHEVGYHYENLCKCSGNVDNAYRDFCYNLQKMRDSVEISTICMHGSPKSRYDNRDIWNKYSYRDLGILGEPYLDTDFSAVLYLSDTGRRWDGYRMSIRDRIDRFQTEWERRGWIFHSTANIIIALSSGRLPKRLMITTHPQRWNSFGIRYIEELLLQKAKNAVKFFMAKKRK